MINVGAELHQGHLLRLNARCKIVRESDVASRCIRESNLGIEGVAALGGDHLNLDAVSNVAGVFAGLAPPKGNPWVSAFGFEARWNPGGGVYLFLGRFDRGWLDGFLDWRGAASKEPCCEGHAQ